MVESYVVMPKRAAQLFASLPPAARRLMRLCDGVRSPERITAECALPRETATQILARLVALGAIAHRRPPAPVATAPFSPDEEAFFAQTIDHLIADEYA